jgi:methylmalonyl-CoA/ethylmalonyl-CoA epimerase
LNETRERVVPEDLFRPSLEGAHHYAYVVENIESTVERLAEQLGAGPFFLVENVPLENIISRGEPAEFVHHSAFGCCGGDPVELMEIVRLVPERIEGRFSGARPGVHHVAWAVPPASVEGLRRELEDRGLPEYLSAQLGELDITFHDASATLGHDIEIHVDSQGLRDFFRWCARAPRVGMGRNRFVPPAPEDPLTGDTASAPPASASPADSVKVSWTWSAARLSGAGRVGTSPTIRDP